MATENADASTSPNAPIGVIVVGLVIYTTVAYPFAKLLSKYTRRSPQQRMYRPFCLTGHKWFDDTRYGVEQVCLDCGKRRDEQ